jgi:hypothetical protein
VSTLLEFCTISHQLDDIRESLVRGDENAGPKRNKYQRKPTHNVKAGHSHLGSGFFE